MSTLQRSDLVKALEELNEQQQQAVRQTEGPVMVIAGPGTGKTQILAARIGHILSQSDLGDIRPDQILCLTYTDAGAVAMRQRLLSFIGAEAYRVGIFTFHSFCNKVIQDRPEIFGLRDLEPISELEVILLLRKLIDGLPADSPLRQWGAQPYYEISRLTGLFNTMKQEGWSSEMLFSAIDEYLESLPHRDEYVYKRKSGAFQKGDLKINDIQEQERKMATLRAAVALFDEYEALMKKSQRYDFQDMISWVRDAFQQDQNLLLDYQEQYQYVLVDEYQDTNGSQNQILNLLTNYWDAPNVFVVGDDDQSIFRFQGASVANIVDFATRYSSQGLHVVLLESNYRSTQTILDAAAALIAHNRERLVNSPALFTGEGVKRLTARNRDHAGQPGLPVVEAWHNDAHETVGVSLAIETLIKEGTAPGDIAVIYRKHDQAEPILAYLQQLGIAVQVKRKADLLQSVFTNNVLKVFAYIDGEYQSPGSADDLLYEILHFGHCGITAKTMASLAWTLRERNQKPGTNLRWREFLATWVQNPRNPTLFDAPVLEQDEAVRQAYQNLEHWIGKHRDWTLQALFEKVTVDGGILAWVLKHPDKIALLEELNTLFDFIKKETAKTPLLTLDGCLRLLDTYREESLRLPVNRSISTAAGVQFLTAHGSKGLEFDHVFVIGCDEKSWKGVGSRGYTFPDTLVQGNKSDDSEESRRLFYVAITRAKRHLTVSYARQDNTGKDKSQNRFVAELQESGTVQLRNSQLNPEQIADYWNRFVEPPPLPAIRSSAAEERSMREFLQNFQLSVTNLNKYLRCPRSFYYETLLRIPSAKNRYMAFGSAVHVALEFYFKRMLESPQKDWPSERDLLQWFEYYMTRHRDSFTEVEYRQDLARGRKFLPLFVLAKREQWSKTVAVERNLSNVVFRGIPLRGKLDRLEFDGNTVKVFDYKTGKNKKEKFKPPVAGADAQEAFDVRMGGDYWRQAVFYKILVDNDASQSWVAQQSVFEFVEPEKNDADFASVAVNLSPDDLERVGEQIEFAWKGIQALDFDRGCQEVNCRWCNFEKNQYRMLAEASEDDDA
ncbi:MAG: AAA family ATPase [Bacteroidetes bacterium]|nr:AAA family ATPase [Bacteroidota bacterium]